MTEFDKASLRVCEEALSLLRQDAPLALDDLNNEATQSVVARKVQRAYDGARLEVLAAHDWNFARQATRVKSVETGGAWHAYRFAKPVDAVKIVRVCGDDQERDLHYTLVGDGVLADEPPRFCEWTQDVTDIDLWPASVRRVFVYGLARDLAIPVTGRVADLKTLDALYQQKMKDAALLDARETHPDPWGEPYYAVAIGGRRGRHRRVGMLREV